MICTLSIAFITPFVQLSASNVGRAVRSSTIEKPNLLIIMTDEHNFRTLGCYRELLSHDQAYVWGDGVNVETPHIDYLAENGIRFSKFYASTPVCSPSRASFVSGRYPQNTGITTNNMIMNNEIITFAEVLKQNGYKTGYNGKWHLDGDGRPQWAPKRQFGFSDNRYMFNRGHWKKLELTDKGAKVASTNKKGEPNYDLNGADEQTFTTDFLTNRALEFIDENKNDAFCYMISYPDPHNPDIVRAPYDKMYTNMAFEAPATYNKSDRNVPSWAKKDKNASIDQSQYFGMIKCIDDNIGRLIKKLQNLDLLENTIIVFTSDHGDLRAEHHKHNKGNPLEASAKVPFIVYYPKKIDAGGVVENAFNTVDFAPTVLNLLDFQAPQQMHGFNFSELLLSPNKQNQYRDITFIRSTGRDNNGKWIAAITSRYKLILSRSDDPWLIDMEKDPDELINFFEVPEYKDVITNLAFKLKEYSENQNDPYLQDTKMEKDLNKLLER